MASVMTLAAATLLLLLPGLRAQGGELTAKQWVSIGMCRANCVNKYTSFPATDSDCIDNKACYMCWQMCERLHIPAWARICDPQRRNICTEGCQDACRFYATSETELVADTSNWGFPDEPSVRVVSDNKLVIDWQHVRRSSGDSTLFPIYILFWRYDDQPHWKLVCMTTEQWAEIEGPHQEYVGLSFRLLAVIHHGVVAIKVPVFNYGKTRVEAVVVTESIQKVHPQPTTTTPTTSTTTFTTTTTPPTTTTRPTTTSATPSSTVLTMSHTTTTTVLPSITPGYQDLQMSVEVDSVDGVLQAELKWSPVAEASVSDPTLYTITWGRSTCRVQSILPECFLLHNSFLSLLDDDGHVSTSLVLPGLTYNSKYWVEVRADGGAAQRLTFYTPWCRSPDVTFTRCKAEQRFEAVTLPSLTKEDLDAVRAASQLPMFITLGVCFAVGVLVIVVAVVVFRRHAEIRLLLASKADSLRSRTNSFRSSLTSRASSFRSSINGGAATFKHNLQSSLRRGGQRRIARDSPIYTGPGKDATDPSATMLTQPAKKSVSFSDTSYTSIPNVYAEIDDVFEVSTPACTNGSLPVISEVDETLLPPTPLRTPSPKSALTPKHSSPF